MVDGDVVVDKLRHVNQYTDDLKRMRGMSKEEYLADMVTQRAVERTFMNLIQSCIDLAQHIRSAEALTPSGTSKKEIEALGNAGILSDETQAKMEEAVGFGTFSLTDTAMSITTSSTTCYTRTSAGSGGFRPKSLGGSSSSGRKR